MGKRISNIFRFQGHRTLKPRSKFILKNRKLGFNTSLSVLFSIIASIDRKHYNLFYVT